MFQGDHWGKLARNPDTTDCKNDPEFVKKIELVRSNPGMLSQFSQDPKMMNAILTLAGLNVLLLLFIFKD